MNWTRDLGTWSLPQLSRQVRVSPHLWHVQEAGEGPTLFLIHGAGGSTHTWRDLIGPLAERYHVVAVDLPGQGFTRSPAGRRSGLEAMAADLGALLDDQGWKPVAILAHSAGAALGLRLAETRGIGKLIGINPALAEFDGVAGWLFPVLAKMLAINPLTVPLFTMGNSTGRARRLIEGTGSTLDDSGLAYYTRLIGDRDHVGGALNMMAHWSLDALLEDLPEIEVEALFLVGDNDKAVPPTTAEKAAERMPRAAARRLAGLGHLAHEEDPERVLSEIFDFLDG